MRTAGGASGAASSSASTPSSSASHLPGNEYWLLKLPNSVDAAWKQHTALQQQQQTTAGTKEQKQMQQPIGHIYVQKGPLKPGQQRKASAALLLSPREDVEKAGRATEKRGRE